jgi:2-oxoglutarate-Fe(II)-dependent oxygenase superfamily protein
MHSVGEKSNQNATVCSHICESLITPFEVPQIEWAWNPELDAFRHQRQEHRHFQPYRPEAFDGVLRPQLAYKTGETSKPFQLIFFIPLQILSSLDIKSFLNTRINMSSNTDLTASIAKELSLFVRSQSVTFTCGGTIHIGDATVNDISQGALTCAPVGLRWDTTDGVDKITFPVKDAAGEAKLAKMCGTCQPATFGLKGENVLDETYRKATKLDRSAFSSDFCPHELGIIDTIAQMLLPNAVGKHRGSGVHAELYKLNVRTTRPLTYCHCTRLTLLQVYGSPSGFFKSHVDTPRSDTQFGSLVISLPCHHEGGQLVVRHAGHEAVFDWSTSKVKQDAICWAAFYSDCEHEVKEITEGSRVTLTYNLFSVPGVGDLAETCPAMDVATIPFYHKVEEALLNPDFMTQGATC